MKFDCNVTSTGRGKYALLNLRTNQIQWGNTPETDFFVLKLKDQFAAVALRAYAEAVAAYARQLRDKADYSIPGIGNGYLTEACEWDEWAREIRDMAERAEEHPHQKLPD